MMAALVAALAGLLGIGSAQAQVQVSGSAALTSDYVWRGSSQSDGDPAVQYRAVAALKKVSGRDLGDDVNKWRAWAADPGSADEPWSIAEAFRTLF